MPVRIVDAQYERTTRDLRLKIGCLRHRTSTRVVALREQAGRLRSSRTYVEQYPISAILVAAGVGLALAGGVRGERLARGWQLIRRGAGYAVRAFVREIRRRWRRTSPDTNPARTAGGDDAGT